MIQRSSLSRIDREIYHVRHPKQAGSFGVGGLASQYNKKMQATDTKRRKALDSYKETICDEELVSEDDGFKHIIVSNIRVPDSFYYQRQYKKLVSLEFSLAGKEKD